MQKTYKNIDDFLEFLEEQSLKDYTLDTGVFQKKDFRGPQFVSCIFHSGDNTPSLQITDHFFKCYSCGSKGSMVNFVMLYKSVNFMEAISILADYYKVKVENMKSVNSEKRTKIESEWEMYLRDMEKAPEEIKKFRKDFWPIEIGYDKRTNYLVLPYTSKNNAILGFTKRVIGEVEPGVRPKWKHSSGYEGLQEQIHNIFNLGNAIGEIGKTKQIIVAEGPKDVIAYLRLGIKNVVCVSGTSNANNIWGEFPKLDEIILSFDNDDAGHHATINSVKELSKHYDFDKINLVILPEGKDPYDVDKKVLQEALDNKVSALEYVIKYSDPLDFYELYQTTAMHNKFRVLAAGTKIKNMNESELKSWMTSDVKKKPKKKDNEKERLISIINGETDADQDEVFKATRVLQLKYKMKL